MPITQPQSASSDDGADFQKQDFWTELARF